MRNWHLSGFIVFLLISVMSVGREHEHFDNVIMYLVNKSVLLGYLSAPLS